MARPRRTRQARRTHAQVKEVHKKALVITRGLRKINRKRLTPLSGSRKTLIQVAGLTSFCSTGLPPRCSLKHQSESFVVSGFTTPVFLLGM